MNKKLLALLAITLASSQTFAMLKKENTILVLQQKAQAAQDEATQAAQALVDAQAAAAQAEQTAQAAQAASAKDSGNVALQQAATQAAQALVDAQSTLQNAQQAAQDAQLALQNAADELTAANSVQKPAKEDDKKEINPGGNPADQDADADADEDADEKKINLLNSGYGIVPSIENEAAKEQKVEEDRKKLEKAIEEMKETDGKFIGKMKEDFNIKIANGAIQSVKDPKYTEALKKLTESMDYLNSPDSMGLMTKSITSMVLSKIMGALRGAGVDPTKATAREAINTLMAVNRQGPELSEALGIGDTLKNFKIVSERVELYNKIILSALSADDKKRTDIFEEAEKIMKSKDKLIEDYKELVKHTADLSTEKSTVLVALEEKVHMQAAVIDHNSAMMK